MNCCVRVKLLHKPIPRPKEHRPRRQSQQVFMFLNFSTLVLPGKEPVNGPEMDVESFLASHGLF